LNANVMSLTGEPLRDGMVIAQIAAPSGKVSSVRLMPAGEEAWGLFTGVFSPVEPGEHRVELSCAEAGSSLETKISVQGTSREKRGQPARLDVLREISRFTKGRCWMRKIPPPWSQRSRPCRNRSRRSAACHSGRTPPGRACWCC
jgi:hypothetical protein